MVRIAVLGCGRIGRMHADNIAAHDRASLAGVFDVVTNASKEVADKHGAKVFSSAEEAISSGDVDAVLIATTTATHADLLETAVAANKPILCEKPIDLSLDRVNRCAQVLAGTKVPIMLGFVRRFDTGHRAVRDAVKSGELGDLHQVVITSRDPGMPSDAYAEASGGIYRDMTIHDFDMARFILGEEVTEVSATGSRLVAPELMERLGDYDTVSVVLKTASGKQCIINNSRQAVYGYDQRVEALGNAGMAVSENKPLNMATFYKANYTGRGAPLMNFFIDRYLDAFMAEIGAFVDTVENGTAPEVGFEDGRLALVLAEAAIKSSQEGRTVKVSEVG